MGHQTPPYGYPPHQNLVHTRGGGPQDQAFSCPPSCICLILTVAWFGALSRVCLHAYLSSLLLVFLSPRICASVC